MASILVARMAARRRASHNVRRERDHKRGPGGRVLKTNIAAMGADQFSGDDEAEAISVALGRGLERLRKICLLDWLGPRGRYRLPV